MKALLKTSLFLLVIMVTSCSSDDNEQDITIELTSNAWEVVKIKPPGESIYLNPDKGYTIQFDNDGTYSLNISPNVCSGNYEVSENENVTIMQTGCTQQVGQTEFATNLSTLFPKMTRYYEKNNELIFEGEGEIVFKPL